MSPNRSRRSRQRPASSCDERPASFKPFHNPLTHLGGGLAGESDGEDVVGIDAGQEQVDVSFDKDPRLAGAGRRFQDDVLRGIDGGPS